MRSRFERIAAGIQETGLAVEEAPLDPRTLDALRAEALADWERGALRRAEVGHGLDKQRVDEVRGDLVRWLDRDRATEAQAAYWRFLDELRAALSDGFRVHLERTELHFAVYPPGSWYARHLDRFRDRSNRIFSTILYLNPDWTADDGGALRVYEGEGGTTCCRRPGASSASAATSSSTRCGRRAGRGSA